MSFGSSSAWPIWRKFAFRFFFVYIIFYAQPWLWPFYSPLSEVQPFTWIIEQYLLIIDWCVNLSNKYLFHVKDQLVPLNGSGDTSYGWASLCFFASFSLLCAVVWSFSDRKRLNYEKLNYWLLLVTRYFLALQALTYGIIKVFALQMYEPNLSQLATPLGDFLPMRLSWMFIGYSTPYQVFSGVIEILVGLLLLYRRTATAGSLLAFGVFMNVAMLNLSYDIPVKLFSLHLAFFSLFLVLNEGKRIAAILLMNKPSDACRLYVYDYNRKWMKRTRFVLKLIIIIIAVPLALYSNYDRYQSMQMQKTKKQVIPVGIYKVTSFIRNGRNVNIYNDTTAWKDIVFDYGNAGSLHTVDSSFRIRYGRSYFEYYADSIQNKLELKSRITDSASLASFKYQFHTRDTIMLHGKRGTDSLQLQLVKMKRHFQLTEKQFHWLSEANR
jgi:hypothetical protein